MRLAQGQLTLLEYCPRRFQHSILESLSVPSSPTLLAAQQWGDRFHLLMQQREMGLPIAPVLAHDDELQTCVSRLQAAAPDLFDSTDESWRQSEHERSFVLNGYWFTVVYDLLRQWNATASPGDRAEIIDWKTYLKPRTAKFLRREWQTRLYLYSLVETTDYCPEQISMTYWFVRVTDPAAPQPTPQKICLPYSEQAHQATHRQLTQLTQQLTALLEGGMPFPQLPIDSPKCTDCPFAVRCQRGLAHSAEAGELPTWEAISEIAL